MSTVDPLADGATTTTGVPDAGAASKSEPEQATFDQAAIDAVKAEAAELRKANEKLMKQIEASANAKLEEQGKFQELATKYKTEAEQATQALQDALITNSLQAEATKAGLRRMEYLRMIDRSNITVENGVVQGAGQALAELKANDPDLFGKTASVSTPSVTPSVGSPSVSVDPTRAYSADQIKAMSAEEFAAYVKAKDAQAKNPLMR